MNYILEIKAFEQWLETHYLPILPQLLWYKLMYFCNRSGWSEWVQVDNLRLMAALQMSREATLIKARGDLIKAGLIEYQKGKKGSPNRYRIISLLEANTFKNEVQNVGKDGNTFKSVVQSEVYPVGESVVQSEVYPVGESVAIYKHKQEQKQNNRPPIPPTRHFEEFLSAYPKDSNRHLTEQEYASLLLMGDIAEEELVSCAKNYAEECRILGTQERFIKSAHNFLKDFTFEKYIPGKYVKPSQNEEKPASRFHNFQERTYNMQELEKALINR